MAFTIEERQTLGIHGLLPPRVKTQEEQVELCRLSIQRYDDDLNKYIYLMGLLVFTNRSYNIKYLNFMIIFKYSNIFLLGSQRTIILSFPRRKRCKIDADCLYTYRRISLSKVRFGLSPSPRFIHYDSR